MERTSVGLKNRIKHAVINSLFFMDKRKNEILLESFPDFSCNTYELYKEMLRKGIDKEYSIVWLIHDKELLSVYKSDSFDVIEMNPVGFLKKFQTYRRKYNARVVITSNALIPKFTGPKDQLHIYLDHGSQLKDVRIDGKRIDIDCDYMITQSDFFIKYHMQQYAVDNRQILTTGLPRYDQLYGHYDTLNKVIPNIRDFEKVVCWVPTFRKHADLKRIDCDIDYKFGIPLVYDDNSINKLNKFLNDNNCLLIIKPHPAQDLSGLISLNSSNIKVIYSQDLLKQKIQIDEFLAQTDAMITDYSSIYYDYLLLNRPIAITMDDFSKYEKQKGFVFEHPDVYIKGEYLYTLEDLLRFINDVCMGIDKCREERAFACNLMNDYYDKCSAERVLSVILEKMNNQCGKYANTKYKR